MSMYVYIKSQPGLWTVGFYNPHGGWVPESDYDSIENAAARVNYLNGGSAPQVCRHERLTIEGICLACGSGG